MGDNLNTFFLFSVEVDRYKLRIPMIARYFKYLSTIALRLILFTCFVVPFLAIAGCIYYPGRVPVDSGLEPEAFEECSNWILEDGESRDNVIEHLGEPWIGDSFRRVDVFRTSDRQHAIIAFGFLLVIPIVFPDLPRDFKGYTLVSYDTKGDVEAADWAFVVENDPAVLQQNRNVALASDYVLDAPNYGHTKLWVTNSRYQLDLASDAKTAASCTLVPVCKQKDPMCWNKLSVDDEDFGYILLLDYSREYSSVPIQLSPGQHRLVFESNFYKGQIEADFTCSAGEVWYANYGSKIVHQYSLNHQIMHMTSKRGEATGEVRFTLKPTSDELPNMLLLYFRGKPIDGKGVDAGY